MACRNWNRNANYPTTGKSLIHVFVTGSESFVGKELLRQCDSRGVAVTGIDVRGGGRADCAIADIRSPDLATQIPLGVDAVIHLAALSRDADCRERAYECFDVNVMGTLNVMRAAQQRAAKQFIFASSEWVYDSFDSERRKSEDDPVDIAKLDSEYAISKLVCEANLRQQHRRGFCPVAILRFGIIYGPRLENWSAVESILNAVATRDEVTVGALSSGRHFIHVADIADAILASVGLPGFQVLNVQGRDLITLGQIAEVAKALLGRNPRIVEKSPGDFNRRPVSSRLAQSVLGWQAQVGLEAGLKSVVEFWEAEST